MAYPSTVPSLVYADDVALLSWTPTGLQQLIDAMHNFCQGMGLTISPTKTEVVVFNGQSSDSWRVAGQPLPVSPSFKYLGLIFHKIGNFSFALDRLVQNGKGAKAQLAAKYKGLHCDTSFPMMRRLFDAVVRPTVSYGCEVWGTLSAGTSVSEIKQMTDIQLAFFRQTLQLRKAVPAPVIFAEMAEVPWLHTWWVQILRFMQKLSNLPNGSLHADVLADNVADALLHPSGDNWAAGIVRQYASLGMQSPFSAGRVQSVDPATFTKAMSDRQASIWDGLHVCPRTAPSARAKLCTYQRWFSRPANTSFEPYYNLPISISKLRLLAQFRMGSHLLPVEQGRFQRPRVPRYLRRCTLCGTHALGDERHFVFECPSFQAIRSGFTDLFDAAGGAMRSLLWQRDQKAVVDCLVAILRQMDMNNDSSS